MDQKPDTRQPDIDTDDLRRLGEEGGDVGLRTGRDPANLGDDVAAEGDLTLPETVPATGEM
jgi:hypothetical protein